MSIKPLTDISSVSIQILSNRQIYVENFKKLILYTNQEIIIDAKDCRVKILGTSLFLTFYSKYEIVINGKISELFLV